MPSAIPSVFNSFSLNAISPKLKSFLSHNYGPFSSRHSLSPQSRFRLHSPSIPWDTLASDTSSALPHRSSPHEKGMSCISSALFKFMSGADKSQCSAADQKKGSRTENAPCGEAPGSAESHVPSYCHFVPCGLFFGIYLISLTLYTVMNASGSSRVMYCISFWYSFLSTIVMISFRTVPSYAPCA